MKPDRLINPRLQYRFNAAAWQRDEDQTTILVAREVIRGGDGISEPDNGNMVLLEMNADGQIMHEDVVWQYTNGVQALEDPRAMVLKDGRVRLGLTAVLIFFKKPRHFGEMKTHA